MRQNTPKAFANLSPGFERSENLGVCETKIKLNPERVRRLANPFGVGMYLRFEIPRLSLRSNLGLKLANAFGVILTVHAKDIEHVSETKYAEGVR